MTLATIPNHLFTSIANSGLDRRENFYGRTSSSNNAHAWRK